MTDGRSLLVGQGRTGSHRAGKRTSASASSRNSRDDETTAAASGSRASYNPYKKLTRPATGQEKTLRRRTAKIQVCMDDGGYCPLQTACSCSSFGGFHSKSSATTCRGRLCRVGELGSRDMYCKNRCSLTCTLTDLLERHQAGKRPNLRGNFGFLEARRGDTQRGPSKLPARPEGLGSLSSSNRREAFFSSPPSSF